MDKVDQEFLDEMIKSGNYGESSEQKAADVKVKDDGTSLDEILVCHFDIFTNCLKLVIPLSNSIFICVAGSASILFCILEEIIRKSWKRR